MHIKAIVTDSAYAIGSYNWTESATTENDELLEIGTNPALRQSVRKYFDEIIKRLSKATTRPRAAAAPVSIGIIDYTECILAHWVARFSSAAH